MMGVFEINLGISCTFLGYKRLLKDREKSGKVGKKELSLERLEAQGSAEENHQKITRYTQR